MAWAAAFNTAVDVLEQRWRRRVASDRPHGARVAHAVTLEATSLVLTWPMIHAMTDLGWMGALVADLALTVVYAAYGYAFHLVFDRLRPVRGMAPP
jgi:uncharacterized membrane protein